jgi:hypothetical protein
MIVLLVFFLCLGSWLVPHRVVGSPLLQEPGPASGSIRCPEDYEPIPIEPGFSAAAVTASGELRAVAIVGDAGGATAGLRDEMDGATDVLEARDVVVTKLYYGVTAFTWGDVVAAAQGAHILLYMGHGVIGWGPPNNWGGFYLGGGEFVSPSTIRADLNGVLAPDSVIIFSHACFTAGSSGDDASVVSLQTAEARVHSYAEPFVDIGMEAYFANNYFNSAAETVDLLLDGETMGDVFKQGVAYSSSGLFELSYPEPGYDLWLDKDLYNQNWNLSFVGLPDYVFQASACPWPDVDCSGSVDVADVQAVASSWRCEQGDECYHAAYDFDTDGIITVLDITRLAAELD